MKNEAASIAGSLLRLLRQSHVPEEVIVVDSDSTDVSMEIAATFQDTFKKNGSQLVLLRCSHGDQLEARAMAFDTAKYPLIISLGVDTELYTDWIKNAVSIFEKNPQLAIAGGPQTYSRLWISGFSLCSFVLRTMRVWPKVLCAGNLAFRKDAYANTINMHTWREAIDRLHISEHYTGHFMTASIGVQGNLRELWSLRAKRTLRNMSTIDWLARGYRRFSERKTVQEAIQSMLQKNKLS